MLAVKVLAFDTGGTILDWHSGLVAALKDCGARRGVERSWYDLPTNTAAARCAG